MSEYESQTFTPEDYGNLYHNARITRHGYTCMLEIHGFKTMAASYDNTVLTSGSIRASLRPRESVTFTIFDPTGTPYRLVIYPDGSLKVYMYSGGSGNQVNVIDYLCYII